MKQINNFFLIFMRVNMKKFITLFIATIIIFGMTDVLLSQDKSIAIGIGGGITRGINEGKTDERTLGPLFGVYALYNNGLGENWTPEFSFSYLNNGTSEVGGYSQYNTTYIVPEVRLRYSFALRGTSFTPYLGAGLGVNLFTINDNPTIGLVPELPRDIESGVALTIPIMGGFTYNITPDWGLDLNIAANLSTTDDYNPDLDDIYDANWTARLGVHYTVVRFQKDSDGDGLTDDYEKQIGTDPNNPDTDEDGLLDGEEVNKYKTDPLDPDTDKGGIKDGVEVNNGADPLDADDDILSIPVGGRLILRNIEFATSKADITPNSERILGFVVKALQSRPDMQLQIVGHTDNTGERDFNMKLSQDRAAAVKNWLVGKGIDGARLTTDGKGPDEPLVPNTNAENMQKNRRVEFYRAK